MGRLASTYWRRAASFVAVCLLVLLAAGPALDSAICQGDALHAAAHGHPVATASAPADQGGCSDAADHGGVCVHGHFHAGSPILSTVASAFAADLTTETYLADAGGVPEAGHVGGIERPPRA